MAPRRSIIVLLAVLLVMGCVAGAGASASHSIAADPSKQPGRALASRAHVAGAEHLQVPQVAPRPLAGVAAGYGYRPVASIAASITRGDAASGAESSAQSQTEPDPSASVRVTATVLPVHIVVMRFGAVYSISSNTPDRDGRNAVWMIRSGTEAGPPLELTTSRWQQVRAALRARVDR